MTTTKRSQRRTHVALLWAALITSLVLGSAFLAVDIVRSAGARSLQHPGQPLSDQQAQAQVLPAAREVVASAGLRDSTGGYTLLSCNNLYDPPYQGAIYLNFKLPPGADPAEFFRNTATALVGHGWTQGLPSNQHLFGQTFTKDGVTAVVYADSDAADRGIVQLYGECRNVGDHRRDSGAWTDITNRLRQ